MQLSHFSLHVPGPENSNKPDENTVNQIKHDQERRWCNLDEWDKQNKGEMELVK